jgi:hypothetical protein
MSFRSRLRKFHAKIAPGGIASHQEDKRIAGEERARLASLEAALGRRNQRIAGRVPVGMDPSQFMLSLKGDDRAKGAQIRVNALDAVNPQLRRAVSAGNISAYNKAFSGFREMISRTTGGASLPREMPDKMELKRKARIRQAHAPLGSRAQTLGFF